MNKQEKTGGFRCSHCHTWVMMHDHMGTLHRNHCPACLWSKHVDQYQPGDRSSQCQSGMAPVGLTLKHEGVDKYGAPKKGELMIVHVCAGCQKININRIAADDDPAVIVHLLDTTQLNKEVARRIQEAEIDMLTIKDQKTVLRELYGSLPSLGR